MHAKIHKIKGFNIEGKRSKKFESFYFIAKLALYYDSGTFLYIFRQTHPTAEETY